MSRKDRRWELDLRLIAMFREVARHGSFTEAAHQLGRSTASVSRAVARLEAELGVRLFQRTTRHLGLTEEGQFYLSELDGAFERIEQASEQLQTARDEVRGRVRLFLPNTFCKNFVTPQLADFLRQHPELSLDIQVGEFVSDPIEGGFDIALQFEKPRDNSYIARRLGSIQLIFAASPDYLARHGVPQSINDLHRHHCIGLGLSRASTLEWNLVPPGATEPVSFRPEGRCFFSGQFDAGVIACVHGVGILMMDVAAALPHLAQGTLKVVLPDHEGVGIDLFLLYPHRESLPRKSRVVIEFVTDIARRWLRPAWFDPLAFAAREMIS